MKRVSIFTNKSHQNKRNKISTLLKDNGFLPMSQGEIVLVIGGDATYLSAVRQNYNNNPLFVGLNSGNLGFMYEFNFSEARKLIQMIAKEKYKIIEYPLYEVEILQKNGNVVKSAFMNDVSIERAGESVIHMEVKINSTLPFNYAADAILISTALGSGAYSMSNLGAVHLDESPTLQISAVSQVRNKVYEGPINPILINNNSLIEIKPEYKKKRPFRVVTDGRAVHIRNPQSIKISKSNKTIRMIRSLDFDYSQHVYSKLF